MDGDGTGSILKYPGLRNHEETQRKKFLVEARAIPGYSKERMTRSALRSELLAVADGPLVLLHLSDIHFTVRSGDNFDVFEDVRNELEEDIKRIVPTLPAPVAAIVVSGDIAFSGKRQEYETAAAWLDRVCELAGCDSQRVLSFRGTTMWTAMLQKRG